jgi:hypothetical protein
MSTLCNSCGGDKMVSLTSIDKKLCPDCKTYQDWALKPGQPSLLIEGKKGNEQQQLYSETNQRESSED